MSLAYAASWVAVCRYDDLVPERGCAVLVGGQQIALFRTHDGSVFALGNRDPYSGACVISRGIVGDREGVPVVVSPMYKQAFALASGVCLDDDGVSVSAWAVRVIDGVVEVRA